MILRQFMQEDGEIIPRQITKLCYSQHARLKKLIHQAHSAGSLLRQCCVKVHWLTYWRSLCLVNGHQNYQSTLLRFLIKATV